MRLTHLSLFTGIGGLDLAAEWAGFRTVGQCEWADYPRAVLEKHWPGMPRWRDIRTLTGDDFFAKTGLRTVTVLSGGFPCQPFSTAGKRRGKDDDRYLWPEMLRVISQIRPAWVVGENVAGIVSMALDTVLSDLESIGYSCQAFVIPACAVDAPHRRDRVSILGYAEHNGLSPTAVPRIIATAGRDEQEGQNQTSQSAGAGLRGNGAIVAHFDGGTVRDDCHDGRTSDREVHEAVNTGVFGGTEEADSNADSTMRASSLHPWRRWDGSGYICEADTDCDNRSRNVRRERQLSEVEGNGGCGSDFCGGTPEHGGREWWPVEPDVGRSHDGFSCWLDGIGGLSDAAKARAGEILRNLRKETYSESIQWAVGRFDGISETEILLAYLCEHEESSYCGRIPQESGTISERQLRDLWRTIEITRASHRRKYRSQLAEEYSNALLRLSHGAPSLMPQAWESGAWESGIERIASGIPSRVDRLKCLGNAVVPQQFHPIFQAIADLEVSQWENTQSAGCGL